jgi:hypothetical protein
VRLSAGFWMSRWAEAVLAMRKMAKLLMSTRGIFASLPG